MSYSTFYGVEVARSGLYTAQSQLNITGHNISNVDTAGYTRQRLSTAAKVIANSTLQFALDNKSSTGQGSEALSVNQIRDLFLDVTYREEKTDTSYWQTCEKQFYMVEQIFDSVLEDDDSSASIYNALAKFSEALSDVSNNVSSKDIRTALVEAGTALTESFNYVYGKLAEQHSNLNTNISTTVGQINDVAESIANLNYQIFGYELTGATANDLRDQRNVLMDELSGYIGYDYYEDAKGQMVISIGGRDLVNGYSSNKITVYDKGCENQLDVLNNEEVVTTQYSVVWADEFGKPGISLEDQLKVDGGSLGAYFTMRDGGTESEAGIPYVVEQLNSLARRIAEEVNAVSRKGYTLPFTQSEELTAGDTAQYHMMNADGTAATDSAGNYIMITGIPMQTAADGTQYYPSIQGVDLFEAGSKDGYAKVNAKNLSISAAALASPYLIGASSEQVLSPHEEYTDENQLMGNNENLNDIITLFSKKNDLGLPDNFSSDLTSLVTSVATSQKHNTNMVDAQETRLSAIEDQKTSISGVSLDDEMTDMVRFTHAYNASARILTTIDDELDTLINKMGRVGL